MAQQKLASHKVFASMVVHDMRNPTCSIEHCIDEMANIVGIKANEIEISEDESEADECVHAKQKKCRYSANCLEKITAVGTKRGVSNIGVVERNRTAQEREFEGLFDFADTAVVEEEIPKHSHKLVPYRSRTKRLVLHPQSRSISPPKWLKSETGPAPGILAAKANGKPG